MRVTRTERGVALTSTTERPYVLTYTQPIHHMVVAWVYHHLWEKLTWRLVMKLERFQPRDKDPFLTIPWGVRQDLRCYHLRVKGRVTVNMEYGEETSHGGEQKS